jgi:hypothetical protein
MSPMIPMPWTCRSRILGKARFDECSCPHRGHKGHRNGRVPDDQSKEREPQCQSRFFRPKDLPKSSASKRPSTNCLRSLVDANWAATKFGAVGCAIRFSCSDADPVERLRSINPKTRSDVASASCLMKSGNGAASDRSRPKSYLITFRNWSIRSAKVGNSSQASSPDWPALARGSSS